jgi:hypothetical protein
MWQVPDRRCGASICAIATRGAAQRKSTGSGSTIASVTRTCDRRARLIAEAQQPPSLERRSSTVVLPAKQRNRAMTAKKSDFPRDKTVRERRKNLGDRDIDELELAGGVEGGMQAGSAGGPSESDVRKSTESNGDGKTSDRR